MNCLRSLRVFAGCVLELNDVYWELRSTNVFSKVSTYSSRRMPGHSQKFNRLEPHSSHDLVFKRWRNKKTEATFGVFCL